MSREGYILGPFQKRVLAQLDGGPKSLDQIVKDMGEWRNVIARALDGLAARKLVTTDGEFWRRVAA